MNRRKFIKGITTLAAGVFVSTNVKALPPIDTSVKNTDEREVMTASEVNALNKAFIKQFDEEVHKIFQASNRRLMK